MCLPRCFCALRGSSSDVFLSPFNLQLEFARKELWDDLLHRRDRGFCEKVTQRDEMSGLMRAALCDVSVCELRKHTHFFLSPSPKREYPHRKRKWTTHVWQMETATQDEERQWTEPPRSADRSLQRYGRSVVNHSYLILFFELFVFFARGFVHQFYVFLFLFEFPLLLKVPRAKARCRLSPDKTFTNLRFVMEPHLKYHPDILSSFSQWPVTCRQKFSVKKKTKCNTLSSTAMVSCWFFLY